MMAAVPSLPESVLEKREDGAEAASRQPKPRVNGSLPEFRLHDTVTENPRPIKVIVIGAGYSGIYCGIRIPERFKNCELVIYEKNSAVGGTW